MEKLRKVGILALFVLFLNAFLFHAYGPVAFVLQTSTLFLVLLGLFLGKTYWRENKTTVVASSILLILLDIVLINRDYGLAQFLLAFGIFINGLSLVYLFTTDIPYFRSLMEVIITPLHLGTTYLSSIPALLTKLFSLDITHAHNSKIKNTPWFSLLIGLAIGLPIVFILVQIFQAADPIYASFIKSLFSFKLNSRLVTHLTFSAIVFGILLPLLWFRRNKEFHSPLGFINKYHLYYEMTVVMALVALTLASFLIVQAPYVFVRVPAETDLSKFGVATYSEYVKKGFGELTLISLFIYGLVWSGLIIRRNLLPPLHNATLPPGLKLLRMVQLLVLSEFGIFLFSIFRRVWLYQSYHGLTLVRIYGTFFLIWITTMALTLFARHFWTKRWVLVESAITILLIITVGVFNAEDFIAKYNPPHVNNRIDYVYLSRMSADGYHGWKNAYTHAQNILVTQNLQQKELIGRNERREVAYAGLILHNLSDQFDLLVSHYGSVADYHTYQTTVITEMLTKVQDYQKQLSGKSLASGNVFAELQIAQKTQAELEQLLKQISSSPNKKIRVLTSMHYFPTHNVFILTVNPFCFTRDPALMCLTSFYKIEGQNPQRQPYQLNTLDYVFMWNRSKQTIYDRFKKEIPQQSLLKLQERYFELREKIIRQPPEERAFDIDISFDTPLL